MQTFNKEGIQELADLAGEDFKEVIARLEAVKKVDESYNNFGGIRKGSQGSVKFIIETEEIKK